ncbi:MAG: hypothetical protein KDB37_16315 [Ilumatobacter sp.]|nr:hypothetical protein [Ilumatobacter sp.]
MTVGLNGSGQFDILNKFGEVHVIVDVVGFLADHHHDDRYYTKSEVGAALGTKANTADVYTKSESDARYPQGYAAVYQDFTSTAWPDGELRSFSTNCPAGLTPTGGGVSSSGYGLVMDSDFPHPYKSATPTGWRAWMRNVSGSQITSIEVSVHVICMDIPNQSGAASAPLTPPLAAVPASDSADRNS